MKVIRKISMDVTDEDDKNINTVKSKITEATGESTPTCKAIRYSLRETAKRIREAKRGKT